MKDIPVFATQYGTAGLVLRQIPYRAEAYIHLLDVLDASALIAECCNFCRMAGAEHIFVTGHEAAQKYPFFTSVITMQRSLPLACESDAALWPVQRETLDAFRKIYNQKAVKIQGAAWMDDTDCAEMLSRGDGYFVHRGETLLGIGRIYDGVLLWVAAMEKGAGADVVTALCGAMNGSSVTLDVASTNDKAMQLYNRLGFVPVKEKNRWYQIL